MQELWSKTFCGNTVLEWLTALAITVAAIVVGKALYWTFRNTLRQLTKRTQTKLEDLIDMVEEPLVFAMSVAGIWYAFPTQTIYTKSA